MKRSGSDAVRDYGSLVLNRTFHREAGNGNERRTTDALQLATTVLYQSPLQHFGLVPNNLTEQPAFVIDFLKRVPAVWGETRYLAGCPGKYSALASGRVSLALKQGGGAVLFSGKPSAGNAGRSLP